MFRTIVFMIRGLFEYRPACDSCGRHSHSVHQVNVFADDGAYGASMLCNKCR